MPPLQLTSLLQTALPHLSDHGRALLNALGCVNGHSPCPTELAMWLGFHDRYQLARALRREGLPPLEVLSGWTRTLYWMIESETTGASLRELAEREQLDPAVAYRLVRRVTGRRWSEVRREGVNVALVKFRDQCRTVTAAQRSMAMAVGETTARRPASAYAAPATPRWSSPQRLAGHVRGVLGERVSVPGSPFDVVFTAMGTALVSRGHAAAVDVLHLNPLQVSHTIRVGPVPSRVIPSRDGQWAYVTSQFGEAIDVIDLQRGQHTATIPVGGHALGAVLSTDGQTLYVATNCDRLVAISLSRRSIVGDVAIPYGSLQLCRHPSGRRLYASCFRSGVIAEIEVPTLRPLRTIEVGGTVQDLAVTSDGQTLYAANEAGRLDVIHLPTGQRIAMLDVGTPALGLALSTDEADVLLSLLYAGRVLVIDRHRFTIRATIHTGGKPRLIAAHHRGSVLVANEAGWVDIIH